MAWPALPDFRGTGTTDAWWKARPTSVANPLVYATSGGGFTMNVQTRLRDALRGYRVPLSSNTVTDSFDGGELAVDGSWGNRTQSALLKWAQMRGLGADTLRLIEADAEGFNVSRTSVITAAWLVCGTETPFPSVLLDSGARLPIYNAPAPRSGSGILDATVRMFNPAQGPTGTDARSANVVPSVGGVTGGTTTGGTTGGSSGGSSTTLSTAQQGATQGTTMGVPNWGWGLGAGVVVLGVAAAASRGGRRPRAGAGAR